MKKYLLSLLLVGIGFISFCSADFFPGNSSTRISLGAGNSWSSSCNGYCCFGVSSNNASVRILFTISYNGNTYNLFDSSSNSNYDLGCFPISGSFTIYNGSEQFPYLYPYFMGSSLPTCSNYTSEECQSEYNLVPSSVLTSCQGDLSSCNSSLNGCQSNLSGCMTNLDNYSISLNTCSTNLNVCNTSLSSCLSSNCPSDSGSVSWSSLFVNGIQHLGAPTIRVNIPEEISRDYLSTSEDFVLDVEGYNQDTEYIESVLEVQNYTPTREDFYNTFMLFKVFSGLIVACLFVIIVFYFVKKLF